MLDDTDELCRSGSSGTFRFLFPCIDDPDSTDAAGLSRSSLAAALRSRNVPEEPEEVELRPRGSGRNVKGKTAKKSVSSKFSPKCCQAWFETYAGM